jgi:hypothetical protein
MGSNQRTKRIMTNDQNLILTGLYCTEYVVVKAQSTKHAGFAIGLK